jgi:hypothetical protein
MTLSHNFWIQCILKKVARVVERIRDLLIFVYFLPLFRWATAAPQQCILPKSILQHSFDMF